MSFVLKKILIGITVVVIVGVGALAYLAAPFVATPRFIVKNESNVSVRVTAHWREETRTLGQLSPGDELEFEVNDEAAMEFQAVSTSGLALSSKPAVYFTSGTVTSAIITESSIEISTEL